MMMMMGRASKFQLHLYMYYCCYDFTVDHKTSFLQVLFEELKLDLKLPSSSKLAKTSVGKETSTSEVTLTLLSPFHHLPAIVLEHRQV